MQERDLRIDLVKLIATAMIVILHMIEPGGGTQQCLYLLGTFGIPLFLTVNGYLMYDREISPSYYKKKFIRYFRFVLVWSVLIGALESVINCHFALLEVLIGAWRGKGHLYHLWFISTLLLILGINCLCCFVSKRGEQKSVFLNTKWMIILIILMNVLFIFNTFCFNTAKVVIGPFRLLTNGGFYVLGMYLHSQKISVKRFYLYFALTVGYIGICILSLSLSITWASDMYSSVFCILSTLSIMLLCLQRKVTDHFAWKLVRFAAPTSIGIWILHPLVLEVLRKILKSASIELTLPLRVLLAFGVFWGCMIITKAALKIKGVRTLFQV